MVKEADHENRKEYFSTAFVLKLIKKKAMFSYSLHSFRKSRLTTKEIERYSSLLERFLFYEMNLLQRIIELENKKTKSHRYNPHWSLGHYFFWRKGGLGYKEQSDLRKLTWTQDEDIYDIAETEGPIALRLSEVQNKIVTWLEDTGSLKRKLDKLTGSLIIYAEKQVAKLRTRRRGRPENELIKRFGRMWAKEIYLDIMAVLQNVKQQEARPTHKNIYKLIESSYGEYLSSKKEEYKQKDHSQENMKIIQKLEFTLANIRLFYNPIVACLINDNKLMDEFLEYDWEPNRFARKITAKLLGIELNTVDHILFKRKAK